MPSLVLHINHSDYFATKPRLALRAGRLITSCYEHYFSYARIVQNCWLEFSFCGFRSNSSGPLEYVYGGRGSWNDRAVIDRAINSIEMSRYDHLVPIQFASGRDAQNPLAPSGDAFLFPPDYPQLGAYFSPEDITSEDPSWAAVERNAGILGSNAGRIDAPAPADFEIRYTFEIQDGYFHDGTFSNGAKIVFTKKFSFKKDVYSFCWTPYVDDASYAVEPTVGSSSIPDSLKDFEIVWGTHRSDHYSSSSRMNGL